MIALILGGSGSGKSAYAEKIISAAPEGKRIYIATMSLRDAESALRAERHRARRAPMGFDTIEQPKDLESADVPAGAFVLLEDLPNLVAGEMFDGGDVRRIAPALRRLAGISRGLVMVTGDVFSDGAVYPQATMRYLKCLSQVNRFAAELADSVTEVVCSIPVPVKGGLPCA